MAHVMVLSLCRMTEENHENSGLLVTDRRLKCRRYNCMVLGIANLYRNSFYSLAVDFE
jgi:hypothetical protein